MEFYLSLPPGEYMLGTTKKLVKKPKGCFRHYKRWTQQELLLASDFTKTDQEVAQELTRTVKSVVNRRFMIRWAQKHQDVLPTT